MIKKLSFLFLILLQITAVSVNAGNDTEQKIILKGTVVDDSGEPLAGVAIKMQGVSEIIYTDLDGNFTLVCSKKGKIDLKLSTVAFKEKKIQFDPENVQAKKEITITLEKSNIL